MSGNTEINAIIPAPSWLPYAQWCALGFVVAGLVVLMRFDSEERATGTAVLTARRTVAAISPARGTVIDVRRSIGQILRQGEHLAHVDTGSMIHAVRAPVDGTLTRLRVVVGQHVDSEQEVAVVIDSSAGYEVEAIFPARYVENLQPGKRLVVKANGGAYALSIDHVDPGLLRDVDAARLVGFSTEDRATPAGPFLLVRSLMPLHGVTGNTGYRIVADAYVVLASRSALDAILPSSRLLGASK